MSISHTYHSGASLYLTFAFRQQYGHEMQQYLHAKRFVQQSFIDHGATLSHHHGVGTEHLPWLTDDISPVGLMAVDAIKRGLDANNVMNPGRLRPSAEPFTSGPELAANLRPEGHSVLALRKCQ